MERKHFFITTAIISIAFLFSVNMAYGHPWLSPYVFCNNNPVKYVDPDGRDAKLVGTGTKEDPYVITANYYYQNGSLNEEQLKGLNTAINDYNKLGGKNGVEVKNADGSTSYVKFNLSAQGVEDVGKAVTGDIFTEVNNEPISFGNRLGTEPNKGGDGNEFGSANGWRVDINPGNLSEGVGMGYNGTKLTSSTYVHEIGHNLGLDHGDDNKTSIMQMPTVTTIERQIGGNTTTYSYPYVDKGGVRIMLNRVNTPRVYPLGVIRTP